MEQNKSLFHISLKAHQIKYMTYFMIMQISVLQDTPNNSYIKRKEKLYGMDNLSCNRGDYCNLI